MAYEDAPWRIATNFTNLKNIIMNIFPQKNCKIYLNYIYLQKANTL